MAAYLAYPYYTLATQMEVPGTGKSTTKSIAAINLPDMSTAEQREAVAEDLIIVSKMLARIMINTYQKTTLTTREEVL